MRLSSSVVVILLAGCGASAPSTPPRAGVVEQVSLASGSCMGLELRVMGARVALGSALTVRVVGDEQLEVQDNAVTVGSLDGSSLRLEAGALDACAPDEGLLAAIARHERAAGAPVGGARFVETSTDAGLVMVLVVPVEEGDLLRAYVVAPTSRLYLARFERLGASPEAAPGCAELAYRIARSIEVMDSGSCEAPEDRRPKHALVTRQAS